MHIPHLGTTTCSSDTLHTHCRAGIEFNIARERKLTQHLNADQGFMIELRQVPLKQGNHGAHLEALKFAARKWAPRHHIGDKNVVPDWRRKTNETNI